jgi:hypothetical protein
MLEAYPATGKIKAHSSVGIQFTFTADCAPTLINANIKVVVRAVVSNKVGQRKQSTMTAKIVEESESVSIYTESSRESRGHPSVVHRATESTMTRMATADLPFGLQGMMPTTVNTIGLVEGARSRSMNEEAKEVPESSPTKSESRMSRSNRGVHSDKNCSLSSEIASYNYTYYQIDRPAKKLIP